MKLSIVHMVFGLVLIVALSFYFRKGEAFSVPHVVPFELEKLAHTQEPFSLPSPSTSSTSSSPSLSDKSIVSVSDTAYQAMSLKQRSDMLRDIQHVIRDEVRMARLLDMENKHKMEEMEEKEEMEEMEEKERHNLSDGQGRDYYQRRRTEQGQEEQEQEYRCPKNPDGSCPPIPDMSQYIRKDQIPCWGCAVDY